MIRLLSALLLFASSASAVGQTVDQVRDLGLAWLIKNQKNDGSWGAKPELFVSNTALALQAFQVAGIKQSSYPRASATTWLLNVNAASVDSLARQVESLAASGANIGEKLLLLDAARNSFFAWGGYAGFDTSYPDTALALRAYRVAGITFTQLQTAVYCEILPSQLVNGGWGYFSPRLSTGPVALSSAAIVPTAYNLMELKAINATQGWDSNTCPGGGPSTSIVSALASGKAFLVTKRNADGGFGPSNTSTVLDTALAYAALKALDPSDSNATAALSYLLTHQDTSSTPAKGSWGADPFQTALVMSVLPAPTTPLADSDQDGIPDGVEILLGKNPNLNDSRTLAVGAGNSFAGLSASAQFSATAFQLVAFSRTVTASGGQPPYAWQVSSGSLPGGLSIGASNGIISGTPNATGTFNFTLAVRDSSGTALNIPGSILVQTGSVLPAILLILLDD